MARRVVVHFGFHKTGTSSAERTLLANADALGATHVVAGRKSWPKASTRAKQYSVSRSPKDIAVMVEALRGRFHNLDIGARGLIVSNVDFSGRLPGLPGIRDYSAVPAILNGVIEAIRGKLDPGAEIILLASIRAREAWVQSLYWQTLKVQRLTEDFETYAARLAPFPGFEETIDDIRRALPGDVTLKTTALEEGAGTPLGPVTPILETAGVAPDAIAALQPTAARKVQPDQEVLDLFLEMNRSELSGEELQATKTDALAFLNTADIGQD